MNIQIEIGLHLLVVIILMVLLAFFATIAKIGAKK
jgi:hypothetical protein